MGRQVGSKNIQKNPLETIASYKHKSNTCYITAVLTGLYASYLKLDSDEEFQQALMTSTNVDNLKNLFDHFRKRMTTNNDSKKLKDGLHQISDLISNQLKLYAMGEYGSLIRVVESIFAKLSPDIACFFTTQGQKILQCKGCNSKVVFS